ncbi:unnamed protein product [Closterium sp. NIES-54]
MSRSSPASAPCSCCPLSHETLLWHHHLGHPSLPRLRGMASLTLRYFLLLVDDYSRYTTVFPLRCKGEVTEVLIVWIRGARHQLSESIGSDLPVQRLHSDRGGEFSSDLLRAFCHSEGIRQTFMLPASPQKNGIAERRIGMVMDVARASMIHAAAPHFLWPFVVQYAAHQINLQPRVSLPETTPTLRWTGKVGDASVFRVWGSRAFVRDTSADKLSSRAVPCVFLGFPTDAPGWQFYHPTSRRVRSSQDVTFDESVSYYRLFPYRTAPLPPLPGAPPVDPLPLQGPAPSGVSEVDPVVPIEVAIDSGAARGAERRGAGPGGAELGTRGAEPERAESGGPPRVPSRREPLSSQRLREWYARRCSHAAGGASGVGAAGGAAGAEAAGAAGPDGVGAAGGAGAVGPRVARTGGTGAAGAGGAAGVGAVGAGALATGAGDPGAEGTGAVSTVSGGSAWPQLYYTRGLTERREPESRPASPESRPASPESRLESPFCAVRTGQRIPRQRPPPVHGTHYITPHPSTAPQHVPLPSPSESSLPDGPEPESDSLRAASPTVTRFLATVVTDPSFETTATSALVAELVDHCCP